MTRRTPPPNPSISADVVKRVVAMGNANAKQAAIAAALGISQPSVSKIMRAHGINRYKQAPTEPQNQPDAPTN